MNLEICKSICNECPFKIGAIQGWLGNHTTDEIIQSVNLDIPFSCHLTRTDDVTVNADKVLTGEHKICRGYVAMATKSAKRFGQHILFGVGMQKLQDTIRKEELEEVYSKLEFKKYHETNK